MPVRTVQSKQNARLKELRRALGSPGRGSLAGIEGPNLIREAMRAGLRLDCVFAAEETERVWEGLQLPEAVEMLVTPRALLDAALATETPQPVAALVAPPQWTWNNLLGKKNEKPLVVILAGIQDPGNLGTILRSAEAFGAAGVVSLPGTVNAWNPKAVRASAGSVFRLPVVESSAEDCFPRLRQAGMQILTATARDAAAADGVDLTQPTALVIGNEGNGVPEEIAALASGAVTIPCPGPVESLNAAVAASVLLYEASRQRGGAR